MFDLYRGKLEASKVVKKTREALLGRLAEIQETATILDTGPFDRRSHDEPVCEGMERRRAHG